MEGGRL
jgi:hypothetical protein